MRLSTLNPAQIMVLQSYATIDNKKDEEDLTELLKNFYAQKLDEEMQRLWDDGTYNQDTLDDLRNQHLRLHEA